MLLKILKYDIVRDVAARGGEAYPFGRGRGLPLIGSMPNRLFCPEDLGGSGELTLVLVDQHAQVLDPELSEG